MTFPTLFTVIHQQCNGFQENNDGNSIRTYSDPVSQRVYCYGPHTATSWSGVETRTGETYLETADLDLMMPKVSVGLKDLFTIESVVYEVVDIADWTHGFHGFQPGIVVALTKWEG